MVVELSAQIGNFLTPRSGIDSHILKGRSVGASKHLGMVINFKSSHLILDAETHKHTSNSRTCRGKYAMEMFSSHLRLHGKKNRSCTSLPERSRLHCSTHRFQHTLSGKTYDYRISYKNVERLLLLKSNQEGKWFFIISLVGPFLMVM